MVSPEIQSHTAPIVRPEIALLLYCARARLNLERTDELKSLIENTADWKYVLEMAFRHGLMPFLYWQMSAAAAELIPRAVMEQLRDRFHHNLARNLLLTKELCSLLSLFEENGITVIPFKGPALALALYCDTAFRQFSDLDLLIFKQDLARARDLLLSRGYHTPYGQISRRESAYLRSMREQLFTHPNGRVHVEIHWAFAPEPLAPTLDSERFRERLEETSLDGIRTHTLSPEDLLLVLCVHGGKHLWERLAWLCDIAELIVAHPDMDWESLCKEASTLRVYRMLLLGIFMVNDLLEVPLPQALEQEVKADANIKALSLQVRRNLFTDAPSSPEPGESLYFNYKIRERRWDGARYCYYITVPPTPAEWAALDLPEHLSFLYYLIRPVRLIKKHAASQLRRLGGL
jgi:hypothetical protein